METTRDLRRRLGKLIARRNAALERLTGLKLEVVGAGRTANATEEARTHLQAVAQEVQHKAHSAVAAVVGRCLTAVFERPYALRIEFEKKRGKTEAVFFYERDGRRVRPGVASGGVMQVASLALRLASLVMTLPPADKFLTLDEPFLGLHKNNSPRVGALVETLASELDCQFLLATHSESLMFGKVVDLGG